MSADQSVANVPPILSLVELRTSIKQGTDSPSYYLEKNFTLSEVLSARRLICIEEAAEPLAEIPQNPFSFATPHAYVSAGAPYGGANPFFLRKEVVSKLLVAQSRLEKEKAGHRLHVFDGYRPQTVQSYMREVDFRRLSHELGMELEGMTPQQVASVWEKVDCLWAPPSSDPQLPPPHSTGAAVDVTVVDTFGTSLQMGSGFDEVSERIHPHYYLGSTEADADEINGNRDLLRRIMEGAGFRRLTHEWWHFSYGDQMWALLESLETGKDIRAIYGEFAGA